MMEVHTNQPGVQLYTGNFLDDTAFLNGNKPCYKHAGFCLETQAYPNGINQVLVSFNMVLCESQYFRIIFPYQFFPLVRNTTPRQSGNLLVNTLFILFVGNNIIFLICYKLQ